MIAGGIGHELQAVIANSLAGTGARPPLPDTAAPSAPALATTGLLGRKWATTHWVYCGRIAKLAPDTTAERDGASEDFAGAYGESSARINDCGWSFRCEY